MNRDRATCIDIEHASELIASFMAGITYDVFVQDAKTQSSVIYQLLVIGEAVKRLSMEFRAVHLSIPWLAIAGMRDHLIHAYDTVDWDEVWNTATTDVPKVAQYLQGLEVSDVPESQ